MIQSKIRKLRARVTWTSQAGGRRKRKVGFVVEVVPAGRSPKSKVTGARRDHVSYVVEVWPRIAPGVTAARQPELYWPNAAVLRGAAGRLPRVFERERVRARRRDRKRPVI